MLTIHNSGYKEVNQNNNKNKIIFKYTHQMKNTKKKKKFFYVYLFLYQQKIFFAQIEINIYFLLRETVA